MRRDRQGLTRREKMVYGRIAFGAGLVLLFCGVAMLVKLAAFGQPVWDEKLHRTMTGAESVMMIIVMLASGTGMVWWGRRAIRQSR